MSAQRQIVSPRRGECVVERASAFNPSPALLLPFTVRCSVQTYNIAIAEQSADIF